MVRDDSDFEAALDADRRDLARDLGLDEEAAAEHPPTATVRSALLRVVQSIQRADVPSIPPSHVEPVAPETALADSVGDALEELLGAGAGPVFRSPASEQFPIFAAAHQKFRLATPPPWILRVDCEDSYEAWRDERRQPYLAALAARVEALEEALADHVRDDHAGRLAALERAFDRHVAEHDVAVLGEEVRRARALAESGGDPVSLSVEPSLARGVEGWQDGDEILCSLFYCGSDGARRVLTAGVPYAACLDAAVHHVVDAGVDPLEIAPVFSRVVHALGASVILPRIAAAAPAALALAGGEVPFACRVVTPGDPQLAAAMSLQQRARGGDAAARGEVRALRAAGAGALLDHAGRQLDAAKKART